MKKTRRKMKNENNPLPYKTTCRFRGVLRPEQPPASPTTPVVARLYV
jgi:hypothetical protein